MVIECLFCVYFTTLTVRNNGLFNTFVLFFTKERLYRMENLIVVVILILFLGGHFAYKYVRENMYRENYFRKIGWITQKENPLKYYKPTVSLRDEELFYYIMQEEIKLKIPPEYHIDYYSDEQTKKDVDEILQLFQNDEIKNYFCDTLKKEKRFYKMDSLEYFMYGLFFFVSSLVDNNISDNKHPEYLDRIYSSRRYGERPYFYEQLSDFGIVCYKLLLITTYYCEKNEKIKRFNMDLDSEDIKKKINNKEVCFWSIRG